VARIRGYDKISTFSFAKLVTFFDKVHLISYTSKLLAFFYVYSTWTWHLFLCSKNFSVADPDPGLGAFLTPGSGIQDG
jgi:hypothetical protein